MVPKQKTKALMKNPNKPTKEEAARSREVFMSLDQEEFGMSKEDEERRKKQAIPVIDDEGTALYKNALEFICGPWAMAVYSVVAAYLTYTVFYSGAGEDAFYYGPMRRKAAASGTQEFDVRFLDKTTIQEAQDRKDKADEKARSSYSGLS